MVESKWENGSIKYIPSIVKNIKNPRGWFVFCPSGFASVNPYETKNLPEK
jgi:hypothetical protein